MSIKDFQDELIQDVLVAASTLGDLWQRKNKNNISNKQQTFLQSMKRLQRAGRSDWWRGLGGFNCAQLNMKEVLEAHGNEIVSLTLFYYFQLKILFPAFFPGEGNLQEPEHEDHGMSIFNRGKSARCWFPPVFISPTRCY